MSNFSSHSHNLVVDEDGQPIFDDNGANVLTSRIADNVLQYVKRGLAEEVFGLLLHTTKLPNESIAPSSEMSANYCYNNDNVMDNTEMESDFDDHTLNEDDATTADERKQWTRKDNLKLISFYKDHLKMFKSSTVRNDKVWKLIANKMENYSFEQCKNKFKYLKAKYVKKKDNMSVKASGQKKITFEFYDEFNDIFGNDPNIRPVAIASTSKQYLPGNQNFEELAAEENNETPLETTEADNSSFVNLSDKSKSKKKNKTEIIAKSAQLEKMTDEIGKLREDLNKREENKQKRHQENLQQKKEATHVFKEYVNLLMKNKNEK